MQILVFLTIIGQDVSSSVRKASWSEDVFEVRTPNGLGDSLMTQFEVVLIY